MEAHPFAPRQAPAGVADDRYVRILANTGGSIPDGTYLTDLWHSDVSWARRPSKLSILCAVQVPPVGGDTLWADMGSALDGLGGELRDALEGRRAVHDFMPALGAGLDPADLAGYRERYPAVEHPVVRTHPISGEKVLYVNEMFTTHLVGSDVRQSRELIALLAAQAWRPDHQCRFRWSPGAVAIWDNRSTQHYATRAYEPPRVMRRTSVVGEIPA